MPNFWVFLTVNLIATRKKLDPDRVTLSFVCSDCCVFHSTVESLPKKWNVTRSRGRLSTHIKCAAVVSRVFNTTTTTGTTSLIHYHSPAFGFFHDLKTSTIDTVFSSLLHFHSPQYFFSLIFVAFLFILLSKANQFFNVIDIRQRLFI